MLFIVLHSRKVSFCMSNNCNGLIFKQTISLVVWKLFINIHVHCEDADRFSRFVSKVLFVCLFVCLFAFYKTWHNIFVSEGNKNFYKWRTIFLNMEVLMFYFFNYSAYKPNCNCRNIRMCIGVLYTVVAYTPYFSILP